MLPRYAFDAIRIQRDRIQFGLVVREWAAQTSDLPVGGGLVRAILKLCRSLTNLFGRLIRSQSPRGMGVLKKRLPH